MSCTLLLFTAYAIVRTVPSANRPNRREKKVCEVRGKDEKTSARQIRGGGRAREHRREYWYCGATQKEDRGVSKGSGGQAAAKERESRQGKKERGAKNERAPLSQSTARSVSVPALQ